MRSLPEILEAHPRFRCSRLVKIDTDGFDLGIIKANLGHWQSALPVIYFEYDPAYFEALGENGPLFFRRLAEAGYAAMLIYENDGDYMLGSMLDAADLIEDIHGWIYGRRSHRYLDIVVFPVADLDVWREMRASELAFFREARSVSGNG